MSPVGRSFSPALQLPGPQHRELVMSVQALIALGSNLGDRKALLDGAIAALAETPGILVRAASAYHETAPIGGPAGQGAFLNAAAALETTLDPHELHARLREVENQSG